MDARLAELKATSKQLPAIITRLAHCPGPAAVQTELADVIRDQLATLDREIAACSTYVLDTEDVTLRKEQELMVAKLAEGLTNHRAAYRRAVLKAQQQSRQSAQLDRDLLFGKAGRSASSVLGRREERGSNAVLQASGDVTAELRRTHAMMSEELARSSLAQELLQGSSNSLKMLNEEYSAFETILAGSKRLIRELERADKMDRWLILGSLGIFIFVVCFILYKRIFSKGVNIVWWLSSQVGALVFGSGKGKSIAKGKQSPAVAIEQPASSIEIKLDGLKPISEALQAEEDALLQGARVISPQDDGDGGNALKDEL